MTVAIRILGIGSPFGDDRAGWDAVAMLRRRRRTGGGDRQVEIRALDRPGLLLVGQLAGSARVILIDAVRSGAPIGSIHRFDGEELLCSRPVLSSHAGGVTEAVQLARTLGDLPSHLLVFGVEADPVNDGDDLTPAVGAALPELVCRIEEQVTAWSAP
jgi:hydrogenase maturation protease